MEVEYVFENTFDATKYPEIDETLAQILQGKLEDMRSFMDKMKGGIRHMRSSVEHQGKIVKYSLKLV